MKLSINKVLFVALAMALGSRSYMRNEEKQAGGLRLSVPIEMPNGVHLSWTGGAAGATYSIYHRDNTVHGATWERIAIGLSGVSGTFFYPNFTLDRDWTYRIQAEGPE